MDIPRYLATAIRHMSGKRAEAEPSPADIGPEHFIVMVDNFWQEPCGTFDNVTVGNWTFEQYGIPVEGYDQALPIRVVYKSHGSGELWRGQVVEQTRLNSIMFAPCFHLPIFGGKLVGAAADMADDGQGADIENFTENNQDGPGLGMIVDLGRDPNRDRVFEPVKKNGRNNGYLAEQHFSGSVFFRGGAEVPDNKRRHIQ